MRPRPHNRIVSQLRQAIRQKGLRATGARIAVLDVLRRAVSPLSHAEVVAELSGESWDRTTLYRNLSDLVRVGLARRSDLGDHVWRYEDIAAAHEATAHPHLVCTECGKLECLPEVQVSLTSPAGETDSVGDQQVEVKVHGLCTDCEQNDQET